MKSSNKILRIAKFITLGILLFHQQIFTKHPSTASENAAATATNTSKKALPLPPPSKKTAASSSKEKETAEEVPTEPLEVNVWYTPSLILKAKTGISSEFSIGEAAGNIQLKKVKPTTKLGVIKADVLKELTALSASKKIRPFHIAFYRGKEYETNRDTKKKKPTKLLSETDDEEIYKFVDEDTPGYASLYVDYLLDGNEDRDMQITIHIPNGSQYGKQLVIPLAHNDTFDTTMQFIKKEIKLTIPELSNKLDSLILYTHGGEELTSTKWRHFHPGTYSVNQKFAHHFFKPAFFDYQTLHEERFIDYEIRMEKLLIATCKAIEKETTVQNKEAAVSASTKATTEPTAAEKLITALELESKLLNIQCAVRLQAISLTYKYLYAEIIMALEEKLQAHILTLTKEVQQTSASASKNLGQILRNAVYKKIFGVEDVNLHMWVSHHAPKKVGYEKYVNAYLICNELIAIFFNKLESAPSDLGADWRLLRDIMLQLKERITKEYDNKDITEFFSEHILHENASPREKSGSTATAPLTPRGKPLGALTKRSSSKFSISPLALTAYRISLDGSQSPRESTNTAAASRDSKEDIEKSITVKVWYEPSCTLLGIKSLDEDRSLGSLKHEDFQGLPGNATLDRVKHLFLNRMPNNRSLEPHFMLLYKKKDYLASKATSSNYTPPKALSDTVKLSELVSSNDPRSLDLCFGYLLDEINDDPKKLITIHVPTENAQVVVPLFPEDTYEAFIERIKIEIAAHFSNKTLLKNIALFDESGNIFAKDTWPVIKRPQFCLGEKFNKNQFEKKYYDYLAQETFFGYQRRIEQLHAQIYRSIVDLLNTHNTIDPESGLLRIYKIQADTLPLLLAYKNNCVSKTYKKLFESFLPQLIKKFKKFTDGAERRVKSDSSISKVTLGEDIERTLREQYLLVSKSNYAAAYTQQLREAEKRSANLAYVSNASVKSVQKLDDVIKDSINMYSGMLLPELKTISTQNLLYAYIACNSAINRIFDQKDAPTGLFNLYAFLEKQMQELVSRLRKENSPEVATFVSSFIMSSPISSPRPATAAGGSSSDESSSPTHPSTAVAPPSPLKQPLPSPAITAAATTTASKTNTPPRAATASPPPPPPPAGTDE